MIPLTGQHRGTLQSAVLRRVGQARRRAQPFSGGLTPKQSLITANSLTRTAALTITGMGHASDARVAPDEARGSLHLLFVCTGNICRSPIAERLAAAQAAQRQISGLYTSSAGTRAVIGHPVHREAASVLQSLGGDASSFGARQLTARIAMDADLILTMTRAHRDRVLELAPRLLSKAFTLAEVAYLASDAGAPAMADLGLLRPKLAASNLPDVPDPIGQSKEVFVEVGLQIATLLAPVLELCRRTAAS
ncbi:arsenate reductase/protein-tyrosine-phosphatase family protein [Mycolicibacterium mengxianglii]|uniref:arsenate reductase/protein-tyrosine-phosphatase family protein n=1 Tax=Mycolicibacterium mengxianglii TaxID=2736649 RepID=UPI0027DA0B7F|nr:low molecular weight phosphatase family protein [Mycolicibacterium mengxianglii]